MGQPRWDSTAWQSRAAKTATKTQQQIFRCTNLQKDLDPNGVKVREARDSDNHPNSTPIIVASDVTGSMGMISESLIRKGIGILFNEILDRLPVPDPQLMIMAIGDAHCDRAPLQVSQFESDTKIADWLEQVYLEGNGGGNDSESYHLPLFFAANHTSTDSWEKRQKKGFLFTIGDEGVPPALTASQIERVLGYDVDADKEPEPGKPKVETTFTYQELLDQASRMYDVYHIIIAEGWYASRYPDIKKDWQEVLGERAIWLDDHNALSELIVSLIQINKGADYDTVVNSWSGDTSLVIANATKNLAGTGSTAVATADSDKTVVMF